MGNEMTRYLKQRNDFSCGPTTIINAMRWLGIKTSRNDLRLITKECKTSKDGTWPEDFERVLEKYIPRNMYIDDLSFMYLNHYLAFNRAVILSYSYTPDDGIEDGHYTLCIGNKNEKYIMVNDICTRDGEIIKPTVSLKTKQDMSEILYYTDIDEKHTDAWLI